MAAVGVQYVAVVLGPSFGVQAVAEHVHNNAVPSTILQMFNHPTNAEQWLLQMLEW